MLHPSTKKLIDRLAEMTASGALAWEERPPATPTYTTEGYTVTLSDNPVELLICDRDGMEVERASAAALTETPCESGGTYSELLSDMRVEALRLARGTETAISTLLERLEDTARDAQAEPAPEAPTSDAPPETIAEPVDTAPLSTGDMAPMADEPLEAVDLPAPSAADPGVESAPLAPADSMAEAAEGAEPLADEMAPLAEPPLSAEETEMAEAVAKLADTVNAEGDRDQAPPQPLADEDALEAAAETAAAGQSGVTEIRPVAGDKEIGPPASEAGFTYIPFGLAPAPIPDAEAGAAPTPEPAGAEAFDLPEDMASSLAISESLPDAAEAETEEVRERIVIDATDDVIDATDDVVDFRLSERDWPSAEAPTAPAGPEPRDATESAAPSADHPQEAPGEVETPPRPRFNPWT